MIVGRPASFRGSWISVRRLTKPVLNSIQDLDDSRRASIRLNTQRRSASACYTVILNLIQDPCFEKEIPICLFGIVLSCYRVQCLQTRPRRLGASAQQQSMQSGRYVGLGSSAFLTFTGFAAGFEAAASAIVCVGNDADGSWMSGASGLKLSITSSTSSFVSSCMSR